MSTFEELSFERTLPQTTFIQLGQLLQQIAQEVGTQALVLTEAILSPIPTSQQWEFTLVVSQQFSALLVGETVTTEGENTSCVAGVAVRETIRLEKFGGNATPLNGVHPRAGVDPSTDTATPVATTEGTSCQFAQVGEPAHATGFATHPLNFSQNHATCCNGTAGASTKDSREVRSIREKGWRTCFATHRLGIHNAANRSSMATSLTTSAHEPLNVRLTFEPEAIALFISDLSNLLGEHYHAQATLKQYSQIQPNDSRLQSKFTLSLFSLLSSSLYPNPKPDGEFDHVSVCQPVENALRQQIAQEQLLNQLTNQIRQSLDLPVIIATVVEQVREFLQVDRLVIYKFEKTRTEKPNFESQKSKDELGANQMDAQTSPFKSRKLHSPLTTHQYGLEFAMPLPTLTPQRSSPQVGNERVGTGSGELPGTGCVIYEARSSDSIPSVLNYQEENCFSDSTCWDKYRQGFTASITDIEKTYILSPCLLDFLKAMQVRAIIITPIVLKEKLWGLLIAHQCTEPRVWLDSEKNLLRSIGEQLAIAIQQAELMCSLKQEKQSLEQRVVERTQALYDALTAAQAANRAKSEFLATMSHELRTPLTSVIGMSATLLRWPLGELSQRQRSYLQIIHDSGEQLLSLINDILELSQIEAGKAALNLTKFSLTALAESSIRSFSEKARRQAVNLTLDKKIPPALHLSADPRRVGQILWNLLSNAIKFTPEGGMVTLRIWSEQDNVILQVEDTGIGISQEQLPLLFEKFQQLDSPLRRRYEGTGLGLALTKQQVELHRGRIEVESTLGDGSVFTVWLPKNYE